MKLKLKMNERIRELERQATSHMPGQPPYDSLTFDVFDKEKFAELIVGECSSIVSDAVVHREPASTYVDKIKKHFGVKE